MTTFIDGPASGIHLPLRRTPKLLRVVQNGSCFDACDQLEDEPAETELIYIYVLTAPPSAWILHRSGRLPVATYRYLNRTPTDAQIRTNNEWKAWTYRFGTEFITHLSKH